MGSEGLLFAIQKPMKTLVLTALFSAAFTSGISHAENLKVETKATFNQVKIQSSHVSRIEVTFTTDVVEDCNPVSLEISDSGLAQKDVLSGARVISYRLMSGEVGCGNYETKNVTIESKPLVIEADSIMHRVTQTLLVPEKLNVVVTEVQ